MAKKPNFITSYENSLSFFKGIKDTNYASYSEKVNNLKSLKQLYYPYLSYFILGIFFLFLAVYISVLTIIHSLHLQIEIKVFLIITFLIIASILFYSGNKMYKIKKILGKDIKILKKALALSIRTEERELYRFLEDKQKMLIDIFKKELEESSRLPFSEDLFQLFCWYINNELKQKFLDGPILKKELFCKLSKNFFSNLDSKK